MKSANVVFKIEKPCNVNLSSMSKNDVGLFCTHCEKHVIDFSKLSDEEVLAIVEKLGDNFCGRFTKSQLDRVFVAAKKKQTSPRLNKILAGLFAFGMLETAQLNAKEIKSIETVQLDSKQQAGDAENVLEKNEFVGDTTKNVVSGTVKFGPTIAITNGSVSVEGTNVLTQLDSAGNFRLAIPDSLVKDSIVLLIYSNGYIPQTLTLTKNELPAVRTIYLQEEIMIEGGIRAMPNSIDVNPRKLKSRRRH